VEYAIGLEVVESRPLAVVRRRATLPELGKVIPEACGLVWNVVKAQKIPGPGRHVAFYLDDDGDLEVGVELKAPFAGHGDVIPSATPAGTVATAVHFGPYPQLPEAHRSIRRWCADHGYALAGPHWELYGHWEHAWCDDPSRIRTDVYYLIRADA
jgi:effector-binding domain-containing protein